MRVADLRDGVAVLDHPGHDVDALRALLHRGFTAQGWRRAQVLVDPADGEAHRTAARAGMRQEGVLRAVAPDGGDRVLMARLAQDPEPETRESFVAGLDAMMPLKRTIAQALVRDERGRVLLCETTYKREWDLPGGMVDPGEPPSATAEREICEELGSDLTVGGLLAVDWLPPYRGWRDAMLLVFDGGVHDATLVERVTLQEREIRAVHWADRATVEARCAPYVVTLLGHLLDRPPAAGTLYLVDGVPRP